MFFRSCFHCYILYLGSNMGGTPCKYIFNNNKNSQDCFLQSVSRWSALNFSASGRNGRFPAYLWKEKSFIIHIPFSPCVTSNVLQLSPFFHVIPSENHKWDQDWIDEVVAGILSLYCICWSGYCLRVKGSILSHSLGKLKPKPFSKAYIIN